MQIKLKAALLIVAIVVLTSVVASFSSYRSNAALIEAAKQRELQNVVAFIQNDLQEQSNKAAARASLIGNLPAVQEAFRAKDRDRLIKRLLPAFLIQRDKYGIREAHFHFAPATSYLRLYDLANQGEDLTSFREMIVATNRTQNPQTGIEIGRRGVSIRGIYPIRDAEGPIGSFEIGMGFEPVLDNVKKTLGFDAAVFVDNELYTRVATSVPKIDSERLVGPMLNVAGTEWRMVRPLVNADMLARGKDVSVATKTVNDVEYGTVLVPMLDYKGLQIGSIVAVRNFSAYQTQLKSALVANIALALLQALLLGGVVWIVLNALLLRPMAALREKLAALSAGKPAVPVPDLLKQNDEIGALAREVEKLELAAAQRAADASKALPPHA